MGYSPRGHKESDTTERLHFTSLHLDFTAQSTTDAARKRQEDLVSIAEPKQATYPSPFPSLQFKK